MVFFVLVCSVCTWIAEIKVINLISPPAHSLRYHSPPEKDSSQEDSSPNTVEKKDSEMSEAPIIKAFKELEEMKAFKDWGTQTEKDDTPTSNCGFFKSFLYSQTCLYWLFSAPTLVSLF